MAGVDQGNFAMSNSSKKSGIVYLVGAGPGNPGLITRTGYELLRHCDAVAYDALIPLELVASLPERVERHYVGRRAGRHSMPQTEKNRLLVSLAQRGLNVVRLKGGDTSFFGGSAEEAECLAAAGIPVVVVPGVTAASAVAASSGLPLTGRRDASWVFFATGHGSAADAIPVPWGKIAALGGGTVVVYMGLANLEKIVNHFLAAGHSMETPCMVVQGATTGLQRILESKLGDIVADCRKHQLRPPALAVIGQVVQHRTPPSSPSLPLSGKRVLATCCARETEQVCAALRRYGAEPLPYPAYILEEVDDAQGWSRFSQIAVSGGWCLFTGGLEVRGFMDSLLRNGHDLRLLGRFKIAACGPAEGELLQRSIRPDIILPHRRKKLSRKDLGTSGAGETLVVFSREVVMDAAEWAEVLRLELFRTKPISWEPHWIQEIRDNPPDYILFRNPAEVAGFINVLGLNEAQDLARKCRIIPLDEMVKAAASCYGLQFNAEEGSAFNKIIESAGHL
jgi:uroporphyrinogen III methyltransferase / synthase